TTIIQKKVTCNNFDVNINGLNADVTPDDITSDLVAAQAQADDDNNNEEISTNSFVDGARNIVKDNNNDYDDFAFLCIHNINVQGFPIGAETPSEGTPSEGTPSEGTPSEGTPSEGTPSEGTPSEGT